MHWMKSEYLHHLSMNFFIIFRSPYIIKYKEAFIEDNPSSLCIVMEHADGGDLYEAIKKH